MGNKRGRLSKKKSELEAMEILFARNVKILHNTVPADVRPQSELTMETLNKSLSLFPFRQGSSIERNPRSFEEIQFLYYLTREDFNAP